MRTPFVAPTPIVVGIRFSRFLLRVHLVVVKGRTVFVAVTFIAGFEVGIMGASAAPAVFTRLLGVAGGHSRPADLRVPQINGELHRRIVLAKIPIGFSKPFKELSAHFVP